MFMTNICIALWFSFSSAYDNLALNKPAHEEYPYVHPDTSASNAVDGLKSDLTALGGQCSASASNQRTSTWWVNLTSIRSIHDIRIYYRTGNFAWDQRNGYTSRFLGFSIYVSNTTNKWDGTLCYKDNIFTKSTIPAVFNKTCFVHGQYVIYYNERLQGVTYPTDYSDYAFNDLCEVEVYGCSTPGHYGINCSICPDVNCRYCHIETGTCQRCKAGYKGDQCELECTVGFFGPNGQQNCTAICLDYNIVTGACDKGCLPGWKGNYCQYKCDGYMYGENCRKSCGNCMNNEQCHHIDGICMNGCENGYQGSKCDKECSNNTYGRNCQKKCNMTCITCDIVTGSCDSGCLPGWKGDYCQNECNDNLYGVNCNQPCGKCLNNEQCHNAYGHCENGCTSGFKGNHCKTECQDGFFGENCIRECPVTCYSCNKSSGICDLGCHPGWKGTYCTEECDGYTYGNNCQEHCGICRNGEECDAVTGVCSNGCDTGYTGDNCKETCSNNMYGLLCSLTCGNCLDKQQCHHVTGKCPKGCAVGFQGEKCDKVKCALPSTESADHRSITYSVSALLALCIVAIIFLTFRLCKHERCYQCHQEKQPKDDRPVDNASPTVRHEVNVEDDTAYQELNEVTYQPKRDDLGHTAVNPDIYVNVEGDNSAYQALGEVTQPSLYDTPFQN